jgi:cytochrome c oxidase assembly protein subunit 15
MTPSPITQNLILRDRRAIIRWLAVCAVLVALMVLVGGYTRLSGSGLSITAWKPVHGTLPPMNAAQWQEEFSAYQQSPQYRKINSGMTLDAFKGIFWPEFIHRLFGRIIGAVFFLPLLVFIKRKSLTRRFGWRLAGIFALGGLQGLIGWLMVKSGLIDNPEVSPALLAMHLAMALAVFAFILWAILDIVPSGLCLVPSEKIQSTRHKAQGTFLLWFALLCMQIVLGALMAGHHAGLIYNTWPLMNDRFMPDSWEDIPLIQFLHRNLAILVTVGFLFWWYWHRIYAKNSGLNKICLWVLVILWSQFNLGVMTLLHMVPLPLALAHQMTALLLFTVSLVLLHRLSPSNDGVR